MCLMLCLTISCIALVTFSARDESFCAMSRVPLLFTSCKPDSFSTSYHLQKMHITIVKRMFPTLRFKGNISTITGFSFLTHQTGLLSSCNISQRGKSVACKTEIDLVLHLASCKISHFIVLHKHLPLTQHEINLGSHHCHALI